MLTFKDRGIPLAYINGGKYNGDVLSIDSKDDAIGRTEVGITDGKFLPMLNTNEREVAYIAGPSGSGKSHYSAELVKSFKKVYPKADVYFFSRTPFKDDPAYKKLKLIQIEIDENLIEEPVDINEIPAGSLVIFDDVTTVRNEQVKNEIQKLMEDILEVGRKLRLWIIICNHLVNPNEKKFGRTILNELHGMTFFPKSGSTYQITYCLQKYFGLNKTQIEKILQLKSRWITVKRTYPQVVLYQNGAYIL